VLFLFDDAYMVCLNICGHCVTRGVHVAYVFRCIIFQISTKHHATWHESFHSLHPEANSTVELHRIQPHRNMPHKPTRPSEQSSHRHVSRLLPLDPRGFEAMGPHGHHARHGGEGKANGKF